MTRFTLKAIAFFFTVGVACAQTANDNLPLAYPPVYPPMAPITATQIETQAPKWPRIYIEPQGGFEAYLTTALTKKHVPVVVTRNKEEAQFVLVGGNRAKGFAGYGYTSATVQLIDQKQEVIWSYAVRKYWNLAQPSVAEAVAKHLKSFLEAHPE